MLPLGRCSPRDTDQGNEQSLEVLEIFSCFVHGVLDGFLVGRFSFPILPRHITPRFPDGSTASSSSKRASSKARMSQTQVESALRPLEAPAGCAGGQPGLHP
jgi:hypothetical protein